MKKEYTNPKATQWYRQAVAHTETFPFSFTYGGVRYDGFDSRSFRLISETESAENGKLRNQMRFRLDDCLEITLKCTHYLNYGASEWTVWFENVGRHNTDVIGDPCSTLTFKGEYPALKGILGDHISQYRPYCIDLASQPAHFESNIGRATHVNFPYFNLEYGSGGTMLAIGWGGSWQADFRADGSRTVYTARSVNGLKTYLKPGEKIRTALFVRADYTVREENYATNYWRSWFIHENMPKADARGNAMQPFSTSSLAGDTGLPNSDGGISERHTTWKPSLEKMLAEDIKVDFRWLDAGWYTAPDGTSAQPYVKGHDWWDTVGTWEPDPAKWPGNTLRESTDFARANGMKTLLWFEPERVTFVEDLVKNYGYQPEWAIAWDGYFAISNNIGNPDCFAWTLSRIKKTLTENRIEMYREDNNSDSACVWRHTDTLEGENRSGITESKLIDAHYRLWDEIIACTLSYGGCGFVDSCASGGGRNDLESMRRGVPLLRSDADRTSTALRLSMTTAFNKWIPFCGASTKESVEELKDGVSDVYIWRASYLPALNVSSRYVHHPDGNFDILRFGLREWDRVKPYLLKDFYVHTSWHARTEMADFTALSYFDPEKREGVLLAFRQEECVEDTLFITLPYAGESEICLLTDEDTGESLEISGQQMKTQGMTLYFRDRRMSRLLWVRVLPQV